MSVKAMGLVWDLECPKKYNGLMFRPSHKFVLLAYADHADHNGKNIWPAVPTIARKTGFDDRSVQRLTNDLDVMGLLVEDGQGPRGTNKWYLPYDEGGGRLSPRQTVTGDKSEDSLGDIPSGDIPSGDSVPPELKEPEPSLSEEEEILQKIWSSVIEQIQPKTPGASFDDYARGARVLRFHGNTLTVQAPNANAREWLEDRIQSSAERALVGIMNLGDVTVEFVVPESAHE
jgi:hypothetical protein